MKQKQKKNCNSLVGIGKKYFYQHRIQLFALTFHFQINTIYFVGKNNNITGKKFRWIHLFESNQHYKYFLAINLVFSYKILL